MARPRLVTVPAFEKRTELLWLSRCLCYAALASQAAVT